MISVKLKVMLRTSEHLEFYTKSKKSFLSWVKTNEEADFFFLATEVEACTFCALKFFFKTLKCFI